MPLNYARNLLSGIKKAGSKSTNQRHALVSNRIKRAKTSAKQRGTHPDTASAVETLARKWVVIFHPIECYREPSCEITRHIGTLPAGTYTLLEALRDFPDAGTDYVLIDADIAGGNVWICSRRADTYYATVEPGR